MRVEILRTLDRLRLGRKLEDDEVAEMLSLLRVVMSSFEEVALQSAVLNRAAAPFPTAVRTLDAIHLTTALLWTEQNNRTLTFLTHDRQLAIAAEACGLEVRTSG